MIRYFRDNIQGNFAKIFIVLICVPFVLFGVDSFFTSSQNPKVAKVNGDSIKLADLQTEMQRLIAERKRQLGDAFDEANFDEERLRPEAISRLVDRKILEQTVADLTLVASDKIIDQEIVKQPIFHIEGKFSADLYKNILRSNNLSPRVYKALVEQDLTFNQLSNAIAATEFLSPAELEQYIRFEYQRRDIEYFIFDAAAELEAIAVTDEQVAAYYAANAAQFMTEETVNVDYVELKLEDFFKPVPEADIQQAYAQQVADMVLPTQRQAAHILVSDNSQADEVQQRLTAGDDFAALAAQYSIDQGSANAGGVLGYTGGELFPPEFEAALASLSIDEVSGPVETEAGIHFIKLLDQKTDAAPSLADLRPSLMIELQKLQALPEFEHALEELKNLAFDSASLAELAAELKLGVQHSGHFPKTGANSGLFARTGLVAMAFSNEVLVDKRISPIQEVSAEHYVVAQMNERKLPEQKPLNSVSSVITQTLRNEALNAALSEKTSAAMAALAEGASLGEVASRFGVSPTSAEQLSRRELPDANRDVLLAAFDVNTRTVPAFDKVERPDGSVAIIGVNTVSYGSLADVDEQTRNSLTMLLSRSYGNETYTSFDAALNEAATIDVL